MSPALRYSALAFSAAVLLTACKGEQGGATSTTGRPAVAAGGSATAQGGSAAAGAPVGTSGAQGAGGTPGMGGMPGMAGMPGMGGMPGMAGMPGMMGGGNTMAQMQAHMHMMRGAGTDSLKTMLPMHRQMVANMLAQMNGEMRQMHMADDAQWAATVDSLRQDLVRMPEMNGAELKAMMPAHMGRAMRLMDMHRAMMGGAGQPGAAVTPARPGA